MGQRARAFSCCARQLTLLPWVDLNLTGISNIDGDRTVITGRGEARARGGCPKIENETIHWRIYFNTNPRTG